MQLKEVFSCPPATMNSRTSSGTGPACSTIATKSVQPMAVVKLGPNSAACINSHKLIGSVSSWPLKVKTTVMGAMRRLVVPVQIALLTDNIHGHNSHAQASHAPRIAAARGGWEIQAVPPTSSQRVVFLSPSKQAVIPGFTPVERLSYQRSRLISQQSGQKYAAEPPPPLLHFMESAVTHSSHLSHSHVAVLNRILLPVARAMATIKAMLSWFAERVGAAVSGLVQTRQQAPRAIVASHDSSLGSLPPVTLQHQWQQLTHQQRHQGASPMAVAARMVQQWQPITVVTSWSPMQQVAALGVLAAVFVAVPRWAVTRWLKTGCGIVVLLKHSLLAGAGRELAMEGCPFA
jgi:hypothetical protein